MLRKLDRLNEGLGSNVHVDVEAERRAGLCPGLGERLALWHRQREGLAVAPGRHDVRDVTRLEERRVRWDTVEVELFCEGDKHIR